MKLAMIGVGQAGGKILDRFLEYDARTEGSSARAAIAVNTARTDLEGLEYVPRENRVLVGQSKVKGHGVGGDNELGAEITEEDITEIQREIDKIPIPDIDAFLVVAALGGGTGSGGGPVIAKQLKHVYSEPVYGLGVLPAADEGGIYTLNAARSFRTFIREADNLMLFDNDAWRNSGASLEDSFDQLNDELVTRFGVLFRAGELEGRGVAESVVDASEISNTLGCGGVSTLGYARAQIDQEPRGLLDRFREDGSTREFDSISAITGLVRQATRGRLTIPCDVEGAERALVVVAGPPEYLNRKGVERARRWIEEETGSMEVRGGDYPLPDSNHIATVILFSGVTNVPRLRELQEAATETQEKIREKRAQHGRTVEELLESGEDLESLF